MNKTYIVGGVVGLVVIGLAANYIITSKSDASQSPTPAPVQKEIQKEAKVIEVEARSFYYKPSVITVKKGEKVKIVMKSVSMMHDFVIDELGVRMPIIKNGNTGEVEFTAEQIGTFEYYCSVGQHRANGQVGTITVE